MRSYNILFLTNNNQYLNLFDWISGFHEHKCLLSSEKLSIDLFDEFKPDLIISYGYRYIIKPDIINLFKNKIINLHISLLPWNRGAHPNIWSFLEDTPKGVTIHFIDEGVDTGDILLRKEILFDENKETLSSSYNKLQFEIQKLFIENWVNIRENKIIPQKQQGKGSIHYIKDWEKISFLISKDGWNTKIADLKMSYLNYLKQNAHE